MKRRQLMILVPFFLLLMAPILITPPLLAGDTGFASYEFLPDAQYTQSDASALFKVHADTSGLPRHDVIWKDPQGETASCTGCSSTPEYSANGYVVAMTWEFLISGRERPSGIYTAVVTTCTYAVGSTCLGWAEAFRAQFTIAGENISHQLYLPSLIR